MYKGVDERRDDGGRRVRVIRPNVKCEGQMDAVSFAKIRRGKKM